MQILKTKWFRKWSQKQKILDRKLKETIENLQQGLGSSHLGNGLYKVRVSVDGRGKSAGYRTIIVYKESERAVFVYGFAKNVQENLNTQELKAFKTLAKDILSLSEDEIASAIEKGVFMSVGEEDER